MSQSDKPKNLYEQFKVEMRTYIKNTFNIEI